MATSRRRRDEAGRAVANRVHATCKAAHLRGLEGGPGDGGPWEGGPGDGGPVECGLEDGGPGYGNPGYGNPGYGNPGYGNPGDGGLMPARRSVPARTTAVEADRIEVRKTYKLYLGGEFPRSESGRSYVVRAADGTPLANAVRASRKDLRDAVRAARKASQGWADKTAMNRGQVLYRVAELMEGRRDQFVQEVAAAEGATEARARDLVARSIDRWVWYAGWADKIAQVLGSSNPVAAPYFNFTIPEPTGVVGVVAPETSSLLGLVSRLAPPLVAGNATVVLASETRPLPAVTLTEVLATSDVPGGVVNLLTGYRKELVPVLAGHVDVDALDTWGVPDAMRTDVELLAADNVKRLSRRSTTTNEARFDWTDDRAAERPEWIAAFLEMKTVWHPIGM